MTTSSPSIVEYIGESNDGKCGYCKQEGNYNSFGFWAHTLTVHDYQALINRNWRRSGQYCYVPKNVDTCCPMYTIKCDAAEFKITKSQKKILKKMNKFLRDGVKEKSYSKSSHGMGNISEEPRPPRELSDIPMEGISTLEQLTESAEFTTSSRPQVENKKSSEKSDESAAKRPKNPMKKKTMRLERKIKKLAEKGLTLKDVKPRHVNVVKTLEDYLNEEPTDGKHRLKVKLVPSNEGCTESIYNVYKKYQMEIHKDPIEKLSTRSYQRFLVTSPLQTKLISVGGAEGSNINVSYDLFAKFELSVHKNSESEFEDFIQFLVTSPLKPYKDSTSPPGYGSFHYQYYLDDELIAVGVIDILPECISSVYFYYNPEYSFLSLGTYASLREIALVRELSKKSSLLKHYYLGFYIPTCPKMRYKANVKPSYLLCPEAFTWHLLDEKLTKEIDAVRYKRINMAESDRDAVTREGIKYVAILFNKNSMRYGDYKRRSKRKNHDDSDEVFEYASKIGKALASRMLLYRAQ